MLTSQVSSNCNCNYTIDEFHIFNPDIRSGSLQGFHSTDRTIEGFDYEWVRPITDPDAADFETFSAEFRIPSLPSFGTKTSSFFPRNLSDTQVLNLIGEGYIQSGCRPTGDWRATVTNPLTLEPMPIEGAAVNNFIITAFPSAPQNIF
ncbi:MAG: EndoU domain-containing protein [Xenococcaceae cyanobacterium]